MPAPVRPIAVAAAFTAAVCCAAAVRRHQLLRRALLTERVARRLEGAAHSEEMQAFTIRLHHAITRRADLDQERAVLDAADLVLDSALATHHDNPEGGPE